MLDEKLDALAQMMAEHMARPFPPGFRGLDVEGRDMVMLDSDSYAYAACVHEGRLSEKVRVRLPRLTSAFGKVLPAIDDEYAAKYYTHLHNMVVLSAEIESQRKK
ncbi:hypothetical protein [Streptomyces poriferorum]|uniref:Uncharacterized protein n=1 Tax=Streptomyces poriferorum TaxID=2798799 RepID=A0ABY9IFW5_9ACTN|nr:MULTISPECIES: hypothetical protein [unclassified Streptomyces]MDP5315646.1 hypothetical protein [Streptomyces sp. Alt4]WLQ54015.1 hypothetical protein P8A19_00430 [Streptomyces sp. Alt2]